MSNAKHIDFLPSSLLLKGPYAPRSIREGKTLKIWGKLAGPTRLELATSGVTGRRSNQLNYDPA